mmetsp:Transcript_19323/g.32310  ORF Transcript_19323/g.32310 Transcript_19323/m.32310 type:complete len:106 (+) Transcript_19323:308-625(+)
MGKCMRQELLPWGVYVCHVNPGFMRTPLLDTAFKSALVDYYAADPAVTSQYDPSAVTNMKEMVDGICDDPTKTVDLISDLLTRANPDFYNPVGRGMRSLVLFTIL